jgi:Ca2+-binding EF-hand superfamily protein
MTSYEGNESDEDQSSSGRPAKYHNPISGDSDASDVLDIDDLSEEHNAGDDAMDSEGVDGGEGDSISNASNSNLSNIPDIASDIIEPSDAEPEEDIQAREEEKNDSGDELGHEKLTALEPIRLKLNAAAGIKEWKEKMDPFDEDESDHLIPEDFFTVCKAIGFKLESQLSTKSAINQIFDAFDSKKSGLLQISAFLDWLASDPVQAVTAETHKQTSKINFPTHREKFGEQVQLIKQRMKAAAMGPGGADWQLLFHHVDSDHSKTISFEEFRRAIRTKAKLTEKKFPHEHLELVYNAIDTDNDQRITSEEFKTWFSNSDSKADFSEKKAPRVPREFEARERPLSFDKNQPIGTHTAPHRSINEISERIKTAAQTKGVGSNFKLLWKRVSINGHESLNLIEFKCAMRDLGVRYPAVSDIDLEALFKHIDVNESNMVDAEEFQQFLNAGIVAQPKHKTKAKDEVKSDAARIQEGILMVRQQFKAAAYSLGGVNWPKFFQDSDTNRNNSLSYEEFRHLIRTKGKITEKKLGDQSLLHIFDLIDLDKNNSITIHEFLEWFEDPSEHAEPGPLTMSNLRTARKAEFKAAADENHLIFEKLKQKLKAAAYSVGGVNWPNLFQNADLDNSGYISLEEFTHLLRTKAQLTDKIFPSESIVKLFNSIDFNEDGIIGVSKFLQYFEDASQDQVATPVVTFKAIQQVDAKQNTDENVTALVTNIGANHSVPPVSTPRHSTGPKPSFVGTTSSQFQQPKTNSSIKSSVSAPSFSQPSAQETQKQPTESLSETETKVDPQFHDQLRQKLKSATFTVAGPNWIKLFSGDSSASLTLEEFRVILRTDGKITEKLFSNDLIRSVFHAVDVNSTSKIEMSDFVAWFSDELSKKAGQRRRNQPIILSGKRGQFDRSGHGFVTGAEDEVNASNSSVSNKEGGPVVSSAPAPVQVETKVATSDIAKKTPTSKAISVESASTFRVRRFIENMTVCH